MAEEMIEAQNLAPGMLIDLEPIFREREDLGSNTWAMYELAEVQSVELDTYSYDPGNTLRVLETDQTTITVERDYLIPVENCGMPT